MTTEACRALRHHLMAVCQQARDCHVNLSVHSLRTYSEGYRVSSEELSWWTNQDLTQTKSITRSNLLIVSQAFDQIRSLPQWVGLVSYHGSALSFISWLKFHNSKTISMTTELNSICLGRPRHVVERAGNKIFFFTEFCATMLLKIWH